MVLPEPIYRLLTMPGQLTIGVSGSRRPDALSETACRAALFSGVAIREPREVLVGDASGIDALTRTLVNGTTVYRKEPNSGLYGLIERSQKLVNALVMHFNHRRPALLLAFPSKPCPYSIRPATHWMPGKDEGGRRDVSGTWSTCGYAAGFGLPIIVFLPALPPDPFEHWALIDCGDGWHMTEAARRLLVSQPKAEKSERISPQ